MNLSIIIVNWNSREYLRRCIASILARTPRTSFEIIVIDSASYDGCDRMLQECYPQVRFIQSPVNVGFARANNLAAAQAVGDWILFLNPDTELVSPAIDTLFAFGAANSSAGILGCRLLNSDGSIQSSCVQSMPTIANQLLNSEALRKRWPKLPMWGMAPLFEKGSAARPAEGISGACLMLRRELFESVGRFTEEYFMYAEDTDLSYKVHRAGYINYYVPSASIIHHGGGSSDRSTSTFAAVMMPEATWRFLRKTRGSLYAAGYRAAMCASALGRLAVLATRRALGPGGYRSVASDASRRKWVAVLRWSLRLDDLVTKYYGANDDHPAAI